jgi:hypothetical protein
MRTTLDIEDDVLRAAKELADREGASVGQIISKLARRGLEVAIRAESPLVRNGVPILPPRAEVITLEHVRRITESGAI